MFHRARRLQNFLTQPFMTAQTYTGKVGQFVSLEATLAGCESILAGRWDAQPEERLYMVGGVPEGS